EVTAAQTVVSCFGENLSEAQATANGGDGSYTYKWTPGNQSQPTAKNLAPGSYTVVATDGSGCTASASVNITQWDEIEISVSFVPPTCHNSADGEMAANIVTGGAGNYSFDWSTGSSEVYIEGLQGGLTYIVTVTDGQGCTGMLSRTLENPLAMTLTTSATDAKCFNTSDGVATVTNVQNAQGMVAYTWDTNAASQTTAAANNLAPGTYVVTVTDELLCTATATETIGNPVEMTTQIDVEDNKCFGDGTGTIDLEVSGGAGGYQFVWSNGGSTSKLVDLDADKYYVTITDQNGCEKFDSAFVSAPEAVTAIITVEDVSCFGKRDGSIHLETSGGTPPFTYSLDGVDFFGSSTLIALRAGDYDVFIRDGQGCVFSDQATVTEPQEMEVKILTNATDLEEFMINYGEEILLDAEVSNANGMVSYIWDASYCGTLFCDTLSDCDTSGVGITCENPISRPDYTNDYFLTAIDENGCRAEDHLQVHVKKQRRVVVPTGFSPNQDNTNDRLTVHGKTGTTIKVFQVFDRWGELLFEQFDFPINDLSMGWDGTFKGKEMMPGVYVWYLEAEYEDGMKESFKGESTLIR
ncbi:MAG: T9SS type B sorting domain-containing protein, partial [Bacteroidota bacterium]